MKIKKTKLTLFLFHVIRLINFLTNREVSQSLRINDEDQVLLKVTEDLAHVEDMIDDCLASLTHYTGRDKELCHCNTIYPIF